MCSLSLLVGSVLLVASGCAGSCSWSLGFWLDCLALPPSWTSGDSGLCTALGARLLY
ncbi:hypothetical protein EXIGLDRAFT_735936, partial [Exidia glandulosa HHB12029]